MSARYVHVMRIYTDTQPRLDRIRSIKYLWRDESYREYTRAYKKLRLYAIHDNTQRQDFSVEMTPPTILR